MTTSDDASNPNSEIGTFQRVTARDVTGSPLGEIGFERKLEPSDMLAKLKPADTARRVEDALLHISGQRPVFRRRRMFPETGPSYSVCEAALWICADEDQQRRGLTAVEFSLRPAPEQTIMKALFKLRTLTRGRVIREEAEEEAEVLIWTENLKQYPADIVLAALEAWPNREDGEWWPTWHDFKKIIDAEASARRVLAESIRSGRCFDKPKAEARPAPDDTIEVITPEESARRKAACDAILAERWPGHKPERDTSHDAETKAINEAYGPGPNDPSKPLPIQGAWAKAKRAEIMADSAAGKYRLSKGALATMDPDHKFGVSDAEREARRVEAEAEAERERQADWKG